MRDYPLAVNLAVASGLAPPHVEFSAVRRGCADMVEGVAVTHVIARSNIQVANLEANRTSERRKPLFQSFSNRI